MADGVPVTHDQRKEIPRDRLAIERRLISPNLRKVLARQHGFRPANQRRQEAIKHLDVHGVISASLKLFSEPVKLSVGQRLRVHDPKFACWRISDIDNANAARSSRQSLSGTVVLWGSLRPVLP